MRAKKIHFMGVGGVGMAALAVLVKAQGADVSGCDKTSSPRTRWLESKGIPVAIGHDERHLAGVDEVVVTPAVHGDIPELLAAKRVRYRGEVLAQIVSSRESIAVCGSHGKTTTATYIARLLRALGEDAAWAIGGETGGFPVAGQGEGVLVVEADESDGTLALYHPALLVVTNCEYDHPDYFKTPEDYFACYETARKNARETIESESLGGLEELFGDASWVAALAPHNRRNARAAVEVALRRGHSLAAIGKVFPGIAAELPDRRFQQIYPPSSSVSAQPPAAYAIADYAHHPTEMKCAIAMARARCKGRLRVLFQPHRYSRTKALIKDFPAAFAGVDEVVFCPVYAAFEHLLEGGQSADLYKECRERTMSDAGNTRYYLSRSCREAWEHARNSMSGGDVTLLLGAGDIIDLADEVRRDMEARFGARSNPAAFAAPVRHIVIGAGTNTWKSDLNLSVKYVQTDGPAARAGVALLAEYPGLMPWMAGIPGTVGGWIKMNAGAFGHSFSEVLAAVKVDGQWIDADECGFDYRKSNIRGEIQDFRLKTSVLAMSPYPEAEAKYLAKRKRFPPGTKGSVFKNPPGDYAGRLLEAVGCKALAVGGAYVWPEHANVIVAGENAQPSDFLALAQIMKARVKCRLGVELQYEVAGLEIGDLTVLA